jgi:hypothetical protein
MKHDTILPPKDINTLIRIKNTLARFPGDLYVLSSVASHVDLELAVQISTLASALTSTKLRMDKIILRASAEPQTKEED